jgi:hypothetical protein
LASRAKLAYCWAKEGTGINAMLAASTPSIFEIFTGESFVCLCLRWRLSSTTTRLQWLQPTSKFILCPANALHCAVPHATKKQLTRVSLMDFEIANASGKALSFCSKFEFTYPGKPSLWRHQYVSM